jgi:hypothetical protein
MRGPRDKHAFQSISNLARFQLEELASWLVDAPFSQVLLSRQKQQVDFKTQTCQCFERRSGTSASCLL